MKREVVEKSIEEIYKLRNNINFPEYQREPKLWSLKDKQLLIDSIIKDIDIPKLYFHPVSENEFEVIDGQQRLWALWEYIDNEYTCEIDGKFLKFKELRDDIKRKILGYKLQITYIKDVSEAYLRELFLRLQLGLLLVTGEKLHAMAGDMRDFIFKTMMHNDFIEHIALRKQRFAKQTLCAQICINSFSKASLNTYARTRYDDLRYFFKQYEKPLGNDRSFFQERTKFIMHVLNILNESYNLKAKELKNRSFILSIYLFAEEVVEESDKSEIEEIMTKFVKFSIKLWQRLKEEAAKGFGRKNK